MRCLELLAVVLPCLATALDNGFSKPAMGFNPWNCFGVDRSGHYKFKVPWAHRFNDTVMREVADAMVSTGLAAAGYQYVNLDCGWTTGFRDEKTGKQIVNEKKYPQGMKSLGDYIHSKGLKYGIYSSASTSQCCSKFYKGANDGSLDHEKIDAQMYAEFGVDYLKFDGCGQVQRSYPAMRDALNATGRHFVISVNGLPVDDNAGKFANSWRTTGDDDHDWVTSLAPRAFLNNEYAAYARPGQFNDADMLEVGNQVALHDIVGARSHFSLWCIMKSPLILGTDITSKHYTADAHNILANPEAIAINQDPLGLQAFVVWKSSKGLESAKPKLPPVPLQSVWAGPLEGGAFTALLLNMEKKAVSIKLTRDMLKSSTAHAPAGVGPPAASLEMRDIWNKKSLGIFQNEWEGVVEPRGVILLKLTPQTSPSLGDIITV